tara:strand:- start:101 stop:601 length:501 start_codon:yes stop_codon:yes gene_type:complete
MNNSNLESELESEFESELEFFKKDLYKIENNINKISIITIYVNNYKIEKIDREKIQIIKNRIESNMLKEFIKNKLYSKDYKLEYVLNFFITQTIEEINNKDNNNDNDRANKLDILKNINSIDYNDNQENFNDENCIFIILNKIIKFKQQSSRYNKKNATKKIQRKK